MNKMAIGSSACRAVAAASAVASAVAFVAASPAAPASGGSAVDGVWKNCAQVNSRYPHGVGKAGARDRTTGVPVTTFRRSNNLNAVATANNKGLDRHKDGIACEAA